MNKLKATIHHLKFLFHQSRRLAAPQSSYLKHICRRQDLQQHQPCQPWTVFTYSKVLHSLLAYWGRWWWWGRCRWRSSSRCSSPLPGSRRSSPPTPATAGCRDGCSRRCLGWRRSRSRSRQTPGCPAAPQPLPTAWRRTRSLSPGKKEGHAGLDATTDDQEQICLPFCDCAVTVVPLLLLLLNEWMKLRRWRWSDKQIKSVNKGRDLEGKIQKRCYRQCKALIVWAQHRRRALWHWTMPFLCFFSGSENARNLTANLKQVFFFADDLLTRWFWSGEIYREEDEEQLKQRSSTKGVSSRNGCYQRVLWPAFTGIVTAVSVETLPHF